MNALGSLLVDLDSAVLVASQYSGGYSGEYLSAEAFHVDLAAAVEQLKAGDTAVLGRLWIWFAPTCHWDDFITEEGIDLGNRIFGQLQRLKDQGVY